MFGKFKNKGLKEKFIIFSFLFGGFLAFISGFYFMAVTSIQTSFTKTTQNEMAIKDLVQSASFLAADARKHEKEYSVAHDDSYYIQFDEKFDLVKKRFKSINELLKTGYFPSDSNLVKKIGELEAVLMSYGENMHKSYDSFNKYGNYSSGAVADVRKKAVEIDQLLEKNGKKIDLGYYLLTIQKNERDYFVTHESKYSDEVKKGVAQFREIGTKKLGAASNELNTLLDAYTKLFETAISLYTEANKDTAKFDNLMDSKEQILVEEVIKEVMSNSNAKFESIKRKIYFSQIVAVASFLIFVLVGVWCYRNVNKHLLVPIGQFVHSLYHENKKSFEISHELANYSNELADASNTQTAAIQESVAAIEEMSSMITHSSNSAQDTNTLLEDINGKAQQGVEIMRNMKGSMENIADSNEELSKMIKIIEEIGSKTKVINDIVFKTQLLSFNASIEAARAGQHGKGFAVVAEEVGKLAQMSGGAALEISKLLDSSNQQVKSLVDVNRARVNDGRTVGTQALDAFEDIVLSINEISEKVKSIADATKEQELGVQQTGVAMGELDKAAHENNEIANKVSHVADEVSFSSKHITEVVEKLNKMFYGDKGMQDNNVVKLNFTDEAPVQSEGPHEEEIAKAS